MKNWRRLLRLVSPRLAMGCLCPILVLTGIASAQGQEKAVAPAGVADGTQTARPDFRFEVASIKPADGPMSFAPGHAPGPSYTPGRYREMNVSLAILIFNAFDIRHGYLLDYPQWMSTKYFSVEATLPDGTVKADVPVMLRHMLEDRFALKFHHETRHVPGYELVVVKTSTGLIKSPPPDPKAPEHKGPTVEVGKDGIPRLMNKTGLAELWTGSNQSMKVEMRSRNQTMEQVAAHLSDKEKTPVKDATGLAGAYDFTLTYSPDLPPGSGGTEAPLPMEHSLLPEALEEQLGLKLRPVKDVAIDVVVVDSVNKAPTAN